MFYRKTSQINMGWNTHLYVLQENVSDKHGMQNHTMETYLNVLQLTDSTFIACRDENNNAMSWTVAGKHRMENRTVQTHHIVLQQAHYIFLACRDKNHNAVSWNVKLCQVRHLYFSLLRVRFQSTVLWLFSFEVDVCLIDCYLYIFSMYKYMFYQLIIRKY